MRLNIVVIPKSGLGTEITTQSIKVLKAIALEFDHKFIFKTVDTNSRNRSLNKDIDLCRNNDAILTSNESFLQNRNLHSELKVHASSTIVKSYNSLTINSPLERKVISGTNILFFNELNLTNDVTKKYSSKNNDYAYDINENTRQEIQCVAKKAFKAAQSRGKKVTLIITSDISQVSSLWTEIASKLSLQYPEIKFNVINIENAVTQLILSPNLFDVILTERIISNILIKQSSVLTGSTSLQSTSYLGQKTSLFFPTVHSNVDVTDCKNPNPLASILSAAMLLEHFRLYSESEMIKTAINRSLELNITTPDLNLTYNNITTNKVGDFIADFITNPHDSNANFKNIHLGQSTII
ncbi:isocitrate/isopropylmalate family dehydrogenase [uncultured Nonlabens sp.]|uniref:isocitrate/isopropylmalate family dehydrogenase n=1 Tax=uncultured Nonlabens sp. TaxID=859306 RepID=UPI00260B4094|nr:isocitrate/isopropylmalate family dehydrogenase [uncultured Nonlabens sp.]